MDFDSLAAAGSMAGSGGVIVMDDSRDMVWALNNINEFYAHESCGQCTPCREGSLWMKKITDRMLAGGGVDPGSGDAEERGRQHCRPHHLCFRRSLRLANTKFRREVPRGVCRRSPKTDAAATAARIHLRRIDQPKTKSQPSPSPTTPAGKKPAPRERSDMSQESRKAGKELRTQRHHAGGDCRRDCRAYGARARIS